MSKYIDADKAIEVCDWYEHEYIECEDYIRTIADDIRHLPAADVAEVKHGRWVLETKVFPYIDPRWTCSECGEETTETTGWGTRPRYNYCPNCGARMDEVEE